MERESRIAQWLRRRAAQDESERPGARSRARSGSSGSGRGRRWGGRGAQAAAGADEAAARRETLLLTAAEAGFPLAPAAHPSGYGCSCVRIGCPTPGRHPVSFAWQTQATTDRAQIERWLRAEPQANFITATGRAHDVLDVPAEAGYAALARLEEREAAAEPGAEPVLGPVALLGEDRMLFFTKTRGRPRTRTSGGPASWTATPRTMEEHPGLRWHCRGSYVLLPPSRLPDDEEGVRWLRPPQPGDTLPEPLTLLETLTDACAEYAVTVEGLEDPSPWPVR
ncbi:bifunctional DNA primase/polymerase [Streptomyces albus]|uniref:bifunctional DNA primase/polymerase n=1 Tax=Streptomyces albus TaxID=1888 RepID=UPI0024E09EAD|nr:bifunctional DNA primase/polymerase [Streptomyces albus]GHJ18469.1 DNA primase [Streptomyces albus]